VVPAHPDQLAVRPFRLQACAQMVRCYQSGSRQLCDKPPWASTAPCVAWASYRARLGPIGPIALPRDPIDLDDKVAGVRNRTEGRALSARGWPVHSRCSMPAVPAGVFQPQPCPRALSSPSRARGRFPTIACSWVSRNQSHRAARCWCKQRSKGEPSRGPQENGNPRPQS
jgi:hypothetical protein